MPKAVEIVISDDFDRYLHAISRCANRPLTPDEIIRRWLGFGFACDMVGAPLQNEVVTKHAALIEQHMRFTFK